MRRSGRKPTLTLHALRAAQDWPEVVLVDLGLPDFHAMKVLKRIREWSEVSVVILNVRDREVEVIESDL